jgi:hypothetical protein
MQQPPSGVRFEQTADGFRLRASCRDFVNTVMRVGLAGVVSSLPFVLWWDLIRGVWTDEGLSFWFTCFFLAVWGAAIGYADWIALVSLFGSVCVTKSGDRIEIFSGIGRCGRTRRLRCSEVQDISEVVTQSTSDGHTSTTRKIVLTAAGKRYKFGWQLTAERQEYIVETIRRSLPAAASAAP